MVELVKQNHLESILALSDKEIADNFGDTVVEHLNDDPEVSVKSLSDFTDK